jgi:hypothetical protein
MHHSPFIADQCLYVLHPRYGQRVSLKECLKLSSLPEIEALDTSLNKDQRNKRTAELWQPIRFASQRDRFLSSLEIPVGNSSSTASDRAEIWQISQDDKSKPYRLCITSSAGIGKTIAVQQARYLRANLPDHLVIYYHFENLPTNAEGFWGLGHLDATSEPFYEQFEKLLNSPERSSRSLSWKEAVNLLIKSKIDAGKATIIVDGLDEHDSKTGETRAAALRKFLDNYPRLHCIVAGRPYAIAESYWNTLFKTSDSRRDQDVSDWTFCCVGMFDRDQICRSLGSKRAEQVFSLAGELKLTPRAIEVLRTLPDESFHRINNLCDVYWESLHETLEEDVLKKKKIGSNAQVAGIPPDTYIEYACALAITMFLENKREVPYSQIADDLLIRLRTIVRWQSESSTQLDERRDWIAKLNSGAIEFRFYQQFDSKVVWRDNTLRDFFAALWMVRYSSEQEIEQLIKRIPARPQVPDDNQVWEFISSMPVGAQVAGPARERYKRWLRLTEAIFEQPTTNPRPTQLMWYAWPRLEEWITPPQESGMPLEVSNLARKIRDRFLGEFDSLQRAPGSGQILREDLIFVPIGPLSDGSWNVAVGHPEEKDNPPRLLEEPFWPYSVSKYPITRRLYTLFDQNHQVHYQDDYKQYSPELRCPVIEVNWYDAQMFSIWCKSRLLSEWEWEYACRGNRDSEEHRNLTHWQLDPRSDRERAKVAWISWNSKGRAWPVDSKQSGSYTNAFDLVDMLGNVWEWTESTYEAGEVSRVLRGGSFCDNGRGASASCRHLVGPANSGINSGFRVARAP